MKSSNLPRMALTLSLLCNSSDPLKRSTDTNSPQQENLLPTMTHNEIDTNDEAWYNDLQLESQVLGTANPIWLVPKFKKMNSKSKKQRKRNLKNRKYRLQPNLFLNQKQKIKRRNQERQEKEQSMSQQLQETNSARITPFSEITYFSRPANQGSFRHRYKNAFLQSRYNPMYMYDEEKDGQELKKDESRQLRNIDNTLNIMDNTEDNEYNNQDLVDFTNTNYNNEELEGEDQASSPLAWNSPNIELLNSVELMNLLQHGDYNVEKSSFQSTFENLDLFGHRNLRKINKVVKEKKWVH